ncbi:MAG: hypothetical protein R2708_21320 [Vicinamibacterales bacterium]
MPLGVEAPPIVGVGAHLKSTGAITAGDGVVVSQHIGDLDSTKTGEAFHAALDSLERLYRVTPVAVAVDRHPDYLSTAYGRALGLPVTAVQHHYAHLAACMADNDLAGPVLGAVWDGTGYGDDGTVWGGEFLRATDVGFERVASLRPFRLIGGDRAAREPRRAALGVVAAMGPGMVARWRRQRPDVFADDEWRVLGRAEARGVNAPVTTSMGRLVDAVAGLAGVRDVMRFEGQAAMLLEQAVDPAEHQAYPTHLVPPDPAWFPGAWAPPPMVVDWAPMIEALLDDLDRHVPVGAIAARVHLALADALVAVATALGERRLLLTGGCFQNRVLTEAAIARLRAAGVQPYWHQRLPPNDGGIAAGQVVAWLRAHGYSRPGRNGRAAGQAAAPADPEGIPVAAGCPRRHRAGR